MEIRMLKEYDDIMTVKDLAGVLRIGINAAYKLINQGIIGSKRIGRNVRIPKQCVIDYINSARYSLATD